MPVQLRFALPAVISAFVLVVATLANPSLASEPRTAKSAVELQSLLSIVSGGETIILSNGNYGKLEIKKTFSPAITLKSETPFKARFHKVTVHGGGGLVVDGIQTGTFAAVGGSTDVALVNARVNELAYFKNASGLRLEGNDIDGKLHALLMNSVSDFLVRGNHIHDAQEDLMRVTGDSFDGVIEQNRFTDMHPEDRRKEGKGYNHADAIQMFGVDGKTPRNITIRANLIYDDPATGAKTTTPQGIFLSDPGPGGYRDILIELNLISVSSANSIYINGGQQNVIVRNNTLIPGRGDGGAVIRLAKKARFDNSGTVVRGNIMKVLFDETRKSQIGGNYVYGRNAPLARLFSGSGRTWQDYVPVLGSPISLGSGLGAETYLKALLQQ